MYDNIGRKIKVLAKAGFIIETILTVIVGSALAVCGEDLGMLILFGGPIIAWLSSWLLYGFGELIDKTCDIARNTYSGEKESEAQSKVDPE